MGGGDYDLDNSISEIAEVDARITENFKSSSQIFPLLGDFSSNTTEQTPNCYPSADFDLLNPNNLSLASRMSTYTNSLIYLVKFACKRKRKYLFKVMFKQQITLQSLTLILFSAPSDQCTLPLSVTYISFLEFSPFPSTF